MRHVILLLFISTSVLCLSDNADAVPPNIVIILADDLGASDLGCYGADLHETPVLDQMAREGLRFTTAYAPAPVCTPSRASLLTGRHPARLGITIWSEGSLKGPEHRRLLQADSRHDLPLEEVTLAEYLHDEGYLTAVVGKWHLGDANHAPETQGFHVNIGGTHWGAPQTFFWPYRGQGRFGSDFRYVPHLEFGQNGEYLTDRLTEESLRIIDHAAANQQPFFLLLSHHAPHTPLEAKAHDIDEFSARVRPGDRHQNPTYAAMIRSLDQSVGTVLNRLKDHSLDKNTIVIFTSDNGGYLGQDSSRQIPVTDNFPLRSGKGSLYEGGLRVPLIIRWPDMGSSGLTCAVPVVLTDLFPTLLTASGITPAREIPLDGVNLATVIQNPDAKLHRDKLYFHYPHYYHAPPSTPASCVRQGNWKLIEYFEDNHVELYNLKDDPSETNDITSLHPEITSTLRKQPNDWRISVDARLPTWNAHATDQ